MTNAEDFLTSGIAKTLAADALAARLVGELERVGARSLLLKGPSIGSWLYGPGEMRPYGDVDLLVPAADLPVAEQTLGELGFVNLYASVSPAWARQHADPWVSESQPVTVDLHRWLWGLHAEPDLVWEHLWRTRTRMTVAGREVEVLGEPERAFALTLHAAHHDDVSPKAREDLRRGVHQLDDRIWRTARDVALSLSAAQWMASGLMLVPGGRELSSRLGLDTIAAAMEGDPRTWSADAPATRMLQLATTKGVSAKARLIRDELFPSASFMRTMSEEADLAARGPAHLAMAYVRRWIKLARSLPMVTRAAVKRRRAGGRF
jgi:hypothetical protein